MVKVTPIQDLHRRVMDTRFLAAGQYCDGCTYTFEPEILFRRTQCKKCKDGKVLNVCELCDRSGAFDDGFLCDKHYWEEFNRQ